MANRGSGAGSAVAEVDTEVVDALDQNASLSPNTTPANSNGLGQAVEPQVIDHDPLSNTRDLAHLDGGSLRVINPLELQTGAIRDAAIGHMMSLAGNASPASRDEAHVIAGISVPGVSPAETALAKVIRNQSQPFVEEMAARAGLPIFPRSFS